MENTLTLPQTILLQKKQVLASYGGALALILNGISIILNFGNTLAGWSIGAPIILFGVGALIFIFLERSEKSKYSTKFQLTDQSVFFRIDFWKPAIIIPWNKIKGITFRTYQIDFETETGTLSVTYTTDAEKSIEIKKLIRTKAEQLGISVVGG